jgi:hypothetical protein
MIACIPSKGRPSTSTYKILESVGFTVYHFLEPQEINSYNVPNKINILKNDMGITYVRNYITKWCKKNNHDVVLFCDDDINRFGKARNRRAVNEDNAIAEIYRYFEKTDFVLGGINQRQFAWSETKNYKINNGKLNGCYLVNTSKVTWEYRENTKEDRDYLAQCISSKKNFIFFPKVFFNTPAIGTNKGGLHDDYARKKDTEWAYNLCKQYPKYTKILRHYGRVDVKIDYKSMAKDMGLKVI